jgi:hypothetical protein
MMTKAEAEQETAGNGGLQFLRSAQGDYAAVVHDRESLTERVGFFHIVSGQQNGFAALVVLTDDFPKEQAGLRVQAGAGFVEEKDLRIVHHGARDGEALHHAAGEAANHLIGAIRQLEALEKGFGAFGAFLGAKAKVSAVESQNLTSGEGKVEIGALRYDSDEALDGDLFLPDVVFADERLAAGGAHARGQDADGRGLSGAVRSQEAEDFSRSDVERNAVEGYDVGLGLLALGFRPAKRKAARACSHGRSGGVDLAEVTGANASYHPEFPFVEQWREASGPERREPTLPMDLSTHGMIPEYRDGSQFSKKGDACPWFGAVTFHPLRRKAAARLPHSIKISVSR